MEETLPENVLIFRSPDRAILKQAESAVPVLSLCREHGMGSASFYKSRANFASVDASMMYRLKELEDESHHLTKIYVERRIKTEIPLEKAVRESCKAISTSWDGWADDQTP